jgi:hypothetical protein
MDNRWVLRSVVSGWDGALSVPKIYSEPNEAGDSSASRLPIGTNSTHSIRAITTSNYRYIIQPAEKQLIINT